MPITEMRPAVINIQPRGGRGAAGLDGANGIDGAPGDQISFNTIAAIKAANVDPAVQFVNATGWDVVGDGAGPIQFKRVTSVATKAYGIQSADGAWWQFFGHRLSVVATGAVGDHTYKFDVSMAAGSYAAVSASQWTPGDVGKYIIVRDAGAIGANLVTTIASYSSPTTVYLTHPNASGSDIADEWAQFGTDDTAAFQTAIDAIVQRGGGEVYINPTRVFLVSRLNLAGIGVSLVLKGDGPNSSRITPCHVTEYGGPTGHVIDMTGSLFVRLEDFQIGAYNTLPMPTTGIFMAQAANGQSNRLRLRNVYVTGKYSSAAFYNFGVPSSDAISSDFYNYAPGAGQHVSSIFTYSNMHNLQSDFVEVLDGIAGATDWSFFDCEWHRFSGAGADDAICIWERTSNITLVSGVISGGATVYHGYYDQCERMTFLNVTHETESEPVIPLYGHYKFSGTVSDVFDPQCLYVLRGGGSTFGPGATTPATMSSHSF